MSTVTDWITNLKRPRLMNNAFLDMLEAAGKLDENLKRIMKRSRDTNKAAVNSLKNCELHAQA